MNKTLAVIILAACAIEAAAQDPKAHWTFETLDGSKTPEAVSRTMDTLEGYVEKAPGIRGNGLRLDGFTTCLRASGPDRVVTGDEITVEAWIALGEYPWNWCPVLTSENDEVKGYRLMIGPLGQASLECAVGGQWLACTSARDAVPLRTWMHLVGVYRAGSEMALYINGSPVASNRIPGSITHARTGYLLGMVARPEKPSDIHRTRGTLPAYFGLDGILDEVSVYDRALPAATIKERSARDTGSKPDIAPRRLPSVEKNPGRFGAYYTKLKYYPGWDRLWPVDQDPDIVVCFPGSAVKLVFWRGIRYGASWVSENENWMSDQSVEAWNDEEGCFEHMQDRHCRFAHVRIIENTEARVVIHWRYAPVSAYDHTWRADPKTGWECWIDEYYYIYPDASAIRKVSWKKGTLGEPRQFQETLALLHPGQTVSDLLEKDYVTVADYAGKTAKVSFVEDPSIAPYGPFSWDVTHPYTVQQYQFKSRNKPFICFEPGNAMYLRFERLSAYDRASGCNHFPVGQARCDGRTTLVAGRMVGREVEGLEVVVVGLDLGALLDDEAHAEEDPLDLLLEQGQGMGGPDVASAAGQGQVDGPGRAGGRPQPGLEGPDAVLRVVLELVDQAAGLAPGLGRSGLQLLEQKGDVALLPSQVGRPELLEGLGVGGFRGRVVEGLPEPLDPVLEARHVRGPTPPGSGSSGRDGRTSRGR